MYIYKIINKTNGKVYVGQTCVSLHRRWIQHKSVSKKRSTKSIIHQAIRKYGIENFSIELLDSATSLEDLNIKEQTWILKLNTLYPKGYNICSGGKQCKQVIKRPSKNKRRVVRMCKLSGEEKVYESITATQYDGFNYKAVCNCCRGLSNSHKNYKWKYEEQICQ